MSYDPKKVIDIALAEVGYLEKETNSNLDSKTANAGDRNYTKYGRDLDALGFYNGRKNGVAWCDQFVDWSFVQAYGMKAALALTFQPYGKPNCGAGCKYSRQYYKNNGRLFDTPQPGDQIFFYSSDKSSISHTGLVYLVDKTYVYTVEGNTSSAGGVVANGGAVAKKRYKLNYARLAGFGRPNWGALEEEMPQAIKPTETVYKLGDRTLRNTSPDTKGDDVLELQTKLNALGFDCGKADGIFGTNTENGVRKFQTAAGIEVTGIFESDSFAALTAYSVPSVPAPEMKPIDVPVDETIWNFLKGKGLNDFAVAGIMGNLYAESALNPKNLQNSYEKSLGFTDVSYTEAVDNGSYTNFVRDSAGYGLVQWTYYSRKQNLLDYAKSVTKSIGDLGMQLEFMWKELQGYTSVMKTLNGAKSVLEASNAILLQYERPADQSTSAQNKRAGYGQKYYDKFASSATVPPVVEAPIEQVTKTEKKVAYAKSKDTSLKGVYLVMVQNGLNMRYEPGILTADNVVKVLPDGATVRNYGYFTEVDGVKWLYVVYGGQTGFVHGGYVHRVG